MASYLPAPFAYAQIMVTELTWHPPSYCFPNYLGMATILIRPWHNNMVPSGQSTPSSGSVRIGFATNDAWLGLAICPSLTDTQCALTKVMRMGSALIFAHYAKTGSIARCRSTQRRTIAHRLIYWSDHYSLTLMSPKFSLTTVGFMA